MNNKIQVIMATVEELSGVVQGLAQVVKEQITQNKLAQGATDKQIQNLTSAVSELTQSSHSGSTHSTERPQTLRLPQVNLPSFTGRPNEDLERFLEQLTNLLLSSGVPSHYFVTYLKQQVQSDSRAYDTIRQAEEEHSNILHTDDDTQPSHKHFLDYFNAIKETLLKKRGRPKDDKIRDLLREYYTVVQGPTETVPKFAHRFLEVQHSLEKLVPKIHFTQDNQDIELQHAFLIKLRPAIAKHLASREYDFKSLQAVIDVAERYDAHFPPNSEQNLTMYVDVFKEDRAMLDSKSTARTKCFSCGKVGHRKRDCQSAPPVRSSNNTGTTKKSDICYYYNRFKKPNCLIQAGGISKCKFNKLHECSVCIDAKCASYKHRQEAQLNSVSSSIDMPDVQNQITSTINAGFEKLVSHLSGLKSNVSDSENLPLFGMPSVVTSKVDLPNLSNRHIM